MSDDLRMSLYKIYVWGTQKNPQHIVDINMSYRVFNEPIKQAYQTLHFRAIQTHFIK